MEPVKKNALKNQFEKSIQEIKHTELRSSVLKKLVVYSTSPIGILATGNLDFQIHPNDLCRLL